MAIDDKTSAVSGVLREKPEAVGESWFDASSQETMDGPQPGRNRIIETGNGSLEQLIINAKTIGGAGLTPDEEGSRQEILEIAEKISSAQKDGVEIDLGKYRIGSGNATDVSMLASQIELDMRLKEEAQKRQDLVKEDQEREEAAQREKDAAVLQKGLTGALMGAAALGGASAQYNLPSFLTNVAPLGGMSPQATEEARGLGGKMLAVMGLSNLAQSQSMGGEALCVSTHHGLSKGTQQTQVEVGIA